MRRYRPSRCPGSCMYIIGGFRLVLVAEIMRCKHKWGPLQLSGNVTELGVLSQLAPLPRVDSRFHLHSDTVGGCGLVKKGNSPRNFWQNRVCGLSRVTAVEFFKCIFLQALSITSVKCPLVPLYLRRGRQLYRRYLRKHGNPHRKLVRETALKVLR